MVSGALSAAAVLDGRDQLVAARADMSRLDFAAVKHDLAQAEASFARAESPMGVVRSFSFVPWVGAQIHAADTGLQAGRAVLVAASRLTDVGEELVRLSGVSPETTTTFDDLPSETKRATLARLSAAAPEFERAAANIAIARTDVAAELRRGTEGPASRALRSLDDVLAEAQEALRVAAIGTRLLPAFAGLETERNTLLLFLNNAELRPGGGFVGAFGLLSMKDGDIKQLSTHDVYALDRPAEAHIFTRPPAPLARYLAADRFLFRDANWSTDFAVSARSLLERRAAEIASVPPASRTGALADMRVHNVVGLTPTFLVDILRIVGEVNVEGHAFNSENIPDSIQYQVEYGYAKTGIPEDQRKELLAKLVDVVKKRLYALPLEQWPEVIAVIDRALQAKQVALYSEDQPVEDMLAAFGWGGLAEAPATGQDALMVVDANLASLKSDPAVRRSIGYAVRFNNSHQLVATTTIRYEHTGHFDWKTTRYRSYVRLYAPAGSRLVKTTGSLANDKLQNPSLVPGYTDIVPDLGFASFGAFISVEPGETRELQFEYILPDAVSKAAEQGRYALHVLKQMGAAPRALTLGLVFDKNILSADPAEARDQWGDAVYRVETTLDQNRTFTVAF